MGFTGIPTKKAVPSSSRLSNQMRPWCSSTSCLTMDMPGPTDSSPSRPGRRALVNLSNSAGWYFREISYPVVTDRDEHGLGLFLQVQMNAPSHFYKRYGDEPEITHLTQNNRRVAPRKSFRLTRFQAPTFVANCPYFLHHSRGTLLHLNVRPPTNTFTICSNPFPACPPLL